MSIRFISTLLAVVCLAATATHAAYLGGVHDIPAFQNIHCANVGFGTDFGTVPSLQVSLDHRSSDSSGYHDAVSHWIVSVSSTGFRACVRETGKHDGDHDEHLHFTWFAHTDNELTSSTHGIVSGAPGSRDCTFFDFGTTFDNVDDVHVQVTLEFNSEVQAATAWVEKIEAGRASVCAEALQVSPYQGPATLHLSAYDKNSVGVIPSHAGEVRFPSWRNNDGDHTSCISVTFDPPLAFFPNWAIATLNHRSYTDDGTHHATTVWAEKFNTDGATFCAAEPTQWDNAHDDNLHVNFLLGASELEISCPVVTVSVPAAGERISESTDGNCLCLEFDCE